MSDIEAGTSTLVLLKVAATIEGKAYDAFSGSIADDNIGIAVGTFETGGEMERIEFLRFLSEESRAKGWTYITVPPGTFYLAFLPPRRTNIFTYLRMFESAPRWRVDMSDSSKLIYAGTFAVDGDGGFVLFGDPYLSNFKHVEIHDERDDAQKLAKEHLPAIGAVKTALMQRHDGPIILTTPTD